MKTSTKRLLIAAAALCLLFCVGGAWAAVKVVAWARDLPNRIVIDADGLGDAFGTAINHAYHEGLANGDASTQSRILNEFTLMAADSEDAKDWIRAEYAEELRSLASSSHAEIASLAAALNSELGVSPDEAETPASDPADDEIFDPS